MSNLSSLLDAIRDQIEADDSALAETRTRLALVRTKAKTFYGALRTYRSGSLAVHTMNHPVTDGDGGVVLNRNYYPGLGPEGNGEETPTDIVEEMRSYIGPLIRETYPNSTVGTSKRGPKVYFHEPLADGTDPTVDLVVALTRKDGDGIWIPNLHENTWDASDPEGHCDLFNDSAAGFRSTRRKVTRLAKAWNKQWSTPGASSFEISVWAYEFVQSGHGVAKGLHALFDQAASRLENGDPTPDPAGVSSDLRLEIASHLMAKRLRTAADNMQDALDSATEDDVQEALAAVFFNYLDAPGGSASAGLAVAAQKVRTTTVAASIGIPVAASTLGATTARAYGDPR
jgi:hypothetical protein